MQWARPLIFPYALFFSLLFHELVVLSWKQMTLEYQFRCSVRFLSESWSSVPGGETPAMLCFLTWSTEEPGFRLPLSLLKDKSLGNLQKLPPLAWKFMSCKLLGAWRMALSFPCSNTHALLICCWSQSDSSGLDKYWMLPHITFPVLLPLSC